jgi:FkbM family methyltransferase
MKASGLLSLFRFWKRRPLASRDLPGTVSRFVRWQIAIQLLPMSVIVPWIGGTQLVVERGMLAATMNLYCGLMEPVDMAFLLDLLRSDDRFLDIGANVGTYTILASGVAHAHSITLKPIPAIYASLQRNLRLNNLEELVASHCQAVGAEPGSLRFTADRGPMNRVFTGSSLPTAENTLEATVQVPVTTVDQLLTGTPAPLLWKVDVEGFEPRCFRAPPRACTIRNSKPYCWRPTPPPFGPSCPTSASPASSTTPSHASSSPSAHLPWPAPATTSSGSPTSPSCSSAVELRPDTECAVFISD